MQQGFAVRRSEEGSIETERDREGERVRECKEGGKRRRRSKQRGGKGGGKREERKQEEQE